MVRADPTNTGCWSSDDHLSFVFMISTSVLSPGCRFRVLVFLPWIQRDFPRELYNLNYYTGS
jgi:hypothetical protein